MTEKDYLILRIKNLDKGLTEIKELCKLLELIDIDSLAPEEKKMYFSNIEGTMKLITLRRNLQSLLLSKYGIMIPNEWES